MTVAFLNIFRMGKKYRELMLDIFNRVQYNVSDRKKRTDWLDRVFPLANVFDHFQREGMAIRTAGSNAERQLRCLIDCVRSANFISWLLKTDV